MKCLSVMAMLAVSVKYQCVAINGEGVGKDIISCTSVVINNSNAMQPKTFLAVFPFPQVPSSDAATSFERFGKVTKYGKDK